MNHAPLPPPPPPPQPQPQRTATFLPSYYPNLPLPPPPSITTVLSELKALLHLSTTALHSLPTPIHAETSTAAATFVPCPFNPKHRLSPLILFSHYLNCPSPISLHHNFHYHLTRSSSSSTAAALSTLPADTSELTVSLDSYVTYNSPTNSFFYQNYPGPVTPATPPPSSLNFPRVLYTECADFIEESPPEASALDFIRLLPSEIWTIRSKIESWGGCFPSAYYARILRAILRLRGSKLLHV